MEKRYRDGIQLIRAAIKKEKVALPEDFDWDNIFSIVQKQRLLAVILFSGALLAGYKRNSKEMGFLLNVVSDRLSMRSTQMKEYEKLITCFEEEGISYMPIKLLSLLL